MTYNSDAVIESFLDQLAPALAGGAEVIVVDNDSSDATMKMLGDRESNLMAIPMGWNAGFAQAVNRGVSASNRPFIAILNPDLSIEPNGLLRLVDLLAADGRIGLAGPLIRQADGVSGNSGAGRFPTVWRTIATLWGVSLLAGPKFLEGTVLLRRQISRRRDVDWLTGACLVSRRTHWDAVGGLSERWFMYGEDVDLGWKMKASGLRVTVEPSVAAQHAVGGSSGEERVRDGDASPLEAAWIVNQYEFYRTQMSAGSTSDLAWFVAAWTGLRARSFAHHVIAVAFRRPDLRGRAEWLARCAVFLQRSRKSQRTT